MHFALMILVIALVIAQVLWVRMYLQAQTEISALIQDNLETGRKLAVTRDAYLDLIGQHETLQTQYVQTLAQSMRETSAPQVEELDLSDLGEHPALPVRAFPVR